MHGIFNQDISSERQKNLKYKHKRKPIKINLGENCS